jgi:hypothetical protein
MAYSYNLETNKSISFEDFIDKISIIIDPSEIDSLIECVEPIQMLSNNQDFLIDKINKGLSDFVDFQKNNTHSAQTISLFTCEKFYVRVNAWPKTNNVWQDELYRILQAHDHNFNFLTVGYHGAGYTTEIWEYDYNSVIGYEGEKVDMKFLESTSLPKGKAMIYRQSQDIHAQFPAQEYSISINVMPATREVLKKEQFWFDLSKKEIKSIAASAGTGRYLMLELAKQFGNSETINIVERISQEHQLPYVKTRALDTLAFLTNSKEEVWNRALNDKDKVVNHHAKLFLEEKLSF